MRKMKEQSENVYENKGPVHTAATPATARGIRTNFPPNKGGMNLLIAES